MLAPAVVAARPTRPIDPGDLQPDVPACEDFYQHASGGWLSKHPIPPDRSSFHSFDELRDRTQQVLRSILESTSARTDWRPGSPEQRVGDFYASGTDERAIERAGISPLRPWLDLIDALKGPEELPALFAALHLQGLPGGFTVFIDLDAKDPARYAPILRPALLGLPSPDLYLSEDDRARGVRRAYVVHVAKVLTLSGTPSARARADAEAVLALEDRLLRAMSQGVPALQDPELLYNARTLPKLEAEAPGFGWAAYFAALGVPATQRLVVHDPEYLAAFARLAASEPVAGWKAYLRWHALRASADLLPRRFRREHFAFYGTQVQGLRRPPPRWKSVVMQAEGALSEELGRLYVARAFDPATKARLELMAERLRAAFAARIARLSWMGPETRAAALAKLAAVHFQIGFPDRWRDDPGPEVSRRAYLENVLALRAADLRRRIARLGGAVDRSEWPVMSDAGWPVSAVTVNAFYEPSRNAVFLPAAILGPPFFWPEADDAVNFGTIGETIGHELTHGFDLSGSQYDGDGTLRSWWASDDWAAFEARAVLMVEQFDQRFDQHLPMCDAFINGRNTVAENIADLGGLATAWDALNASLGRDPNDAPRVDGLTPGQRFFLAYAGSMRGNMSCAALRLLLQTNTHSPPRWSVNGPLSNLPAFHAAFGCAEGSSMYRPPGVRPDIW